MTTPVRLLGIPGSLRRDSYNRWALQAAQQLLPEGASLDIHDLHDIPLYNQDLEQPTPEPVVRLKAAVRAADAIVFATPEYNYSIPGVLKNAIDWASRPYGDSAWKGKPVAVLGASVGLLGTARAQYQLRQVFVFLDMHALNQPEVMIGNAASRFSDSGALTDETSRKLIQQQMAALVALARQLTAPVG